MSTPAWLAFDPNASRYLGSMWLGSDGRWKVRALDTSRRGDVARLTNVDRDGHYRNVPLARLRRDYTELCA